MLLQKVYLIIIAYSALLHILSNSHNFQGREYSFLAGPPRLLVIQLSNFAAASAPATGGSDWLSDGLFFRLVLKGGTQTIVVSVPLLNDPRLLIRLLSFVLQWKVH